MSTLDPFFLAPDFRRNPKTKHFCHLCQRDISGNYKTVRASDDYMCAIDPESQEGSLINVGPECAKKIPKAYYIERN